jgi:predicted nucleic acid-binding protein
VHEKNCSVWKESSPKSTDCWFPRARTGLSKIGRKYGFEMVGRSRLTNDALIAMSAVSRGLIVQTKNPADFKLTAEARTSSWEVI